MAIERMAASAHMWGPCETRSQYMVLSGAMLLGNVRACMASRNDFALACAASPWIRLNMPSDALRKSLPPLGFRGEGRVVLASPVAVLPWGTGPSPVQADHHDSPTEWNGNSDDGTVLVTRPGCNRMGDSSIELNVVPGGVVSSCFKLSEPTYQEENGWWVMIQAEGSVAEAVCKGLGWAPAIGSGVDRDDREEWNSVEIRAEADAVVGTEVTSFHQVRQSRCRSARRRTGWKRVHPPRWRSS